MPLNYEIQPQEPKTESVGNKEVGVIKIPCFGMLLESERNFIEENSEGLPDLRQECVRLANAIAKETGKSMQEVYDALTNSDAQALSSHLETLVEFTNLMQKVGSKRQLIKATAIIRFRLEPEWTIEDTANPKLIHPGLVRLISNFAQRETEGGTSLLLESEASSKP